VIRKEDQNQFSLLSRFTAKHSDVLDCKMTGGRTDLKIEPQAEFPLSQTSAAFGDRVAPISVTIYSTYKLIHPDDGVMNDRKWE
jgi:hypothetical protein